jgi:hypothetical protein
MENGKLLGYNSIIKRDSPGTFLGIPLKRLNVHNTTSWPEFFVPPVASLISYLQQFIN